MFVAGESLLGGQLPAKVFDFLNFLKFLRKFYFLSALGKIILQNIILASIS